MPKLKTAIKKYCSVPSLIFFGAALLSGAVHIISERSQSFSDFFNRYISSAVREVTAALTGVLPFSLAETVIITIPVTVVCIMVCGVVKSNRSTVGGIRYMTGLASVVALLYSLFVITTAVAYNGTPLGRKLGLICEAVSPEELASAAVYMKEGAEGELDEISFTYTDGSRMPYSANELNRRLMSAFDKASEKYAFLPRLNSKIKPIALSEPMTYTHVSGIYTYYTGEANINTNFPDYTIPFTAAHELCHQRGIMPENEANFMAFLVCMESEDPYIRYSAYMNMYEYLNSALYSADYDAFALIYKSLDDRLVSEMSAYNRFFAKYRENTAADISSALNDSYLKSQGQTAGEKSYGMVVDLAVAYVKNLNTD